MSTLEMLRARIESTEDLQSLIRSMKSLAAANVHQFDGATTSLRAFRETIDLGLQALFMQHPWHELRTPVRSGSDVLIAFGSDRGLCGNFNEAIADLVGRHVSRGGDAASDHDIIAVGGQAAALMTELGAAPRDAIALPSTLHGLGEVCEHILILLDDRQQAAPIRRVETIFNSRTEDGRTVPRAHVILPAPADHLRVLQQRPWPSRRRPTFSVAAGALFSWLIRQHIFASLMHAGLSSMASENAARLDAMTRAEQRIGDLLQSLTSDYRTLRQTTITRELIDLVRGYEVLRSD